MKVARLTALRTGRLYPQEIFLVVTSVKSRVALRAMVRPEEVNEKSSPNRTRDLPAYKRSASTKCAIAYPHFVHRPHWKQEIRCIVGYIAEFVWK
jgi:hypothetical protein